MVKDLWHDITILIWPLIVIWPRQPETVSMPAIHLCIQYQTCNHIYNDTRKSKVELVHIAIAMHNIAIILHIYSPGIQTLAHMAVS